MYCSSWVVLYTIMKLIVKTLLYTEIVLGHVPVEAEFTGKLPAGEQPVIGHLYHQPESASVSAEAIGNSDKVESDSTSDLVANSSKMADAAAVMDSSKQTLEMPMKRRELSDTQVGIIIGALGATVFLLAAAISLLVIRRRRIKQDKKHEPFFHQTGAAALLQCSADDKQCSTTTTSRYSPVGTSDTDETRCSMAHLSHLPTLVYSEPLDSIAGKRQEEEDEAGLYSDVRLLSSAFTGK